jgi:hypothetical protein
MIITILILLKILFSRLNAKRIKIQILLPVLFLSLSATLA